MASTAAKNAAPAPKDAKDAPEDKAAKTEPKPNKAQPAQPVKITATRLKQVEAKVERANNLLNEADAELDAMLVGKDPERSPIVAQVAEIKHLLVTTAPAFEEVPGRVTRVIDDVEGML